MGHRTTNAENSDMDKNNSNPDDSNDLQNTIGSDIDTTGGCTSTSNMDNRFAKKRSCDKEEVVTSVADTSGSSPRLRPRSKPVFLPPRRLYTASQSSSSAKKKNVEKATTLEMKGSERDDQSNDSSIIAQRVENISDHEKDGCKIDNISAPTALALDKMKFNIEIDPNVEDRYSASGFTAEESAPESPETRRQRIDIISRQCRLHPANKKYNQGPVENPPLITPGKMVGYTPGGQRHEMDLNSNRPTCFNSEYAQLQWDYATIVNATRMFHELETGSFLPDGLDPDIERRHFALQEIAAREATEHFQKMAESLSDPANPSDMSVEEDEHIRLLAVEKELIDLAKYAELRVHDFAGEIDQKLRKACDLPLTPLMIKKNPVILDILETLATQCVRIEVILAARALIDKIKGLFDVPENQEFRDFFAAEVEKLKERTQHMSGYDIMVMTEEPPVPDEAESSLSTVDTAPIIRQPEEELRLSEAEIEWVPLENGDVYVDVETNSTASDDDLVYGEADSTTPSIQNEHSDDDSVSRMSVDTVWIPVDDDSLSYPSDSDDDIPPLGGVISEE